MLKLSRTLDTIPDLACVSSAKNKDRSAPVHFSPPHFTVSSNHDHKISGALYSAVTGLAPALEVRQ